MQPCVREQVVQVPHVTHACAPAALRAVGGTLPADVGGRGAAVYIGFLSMCTHGPVENV